MPTPELPASASGIVTGRLTCYAGQILRHGMPPVHEGDTHRTLKPSTLMNLRYRYAIVPNALKVALINVTAAMAW